MMNPANTPMFAAIKDNHSIAVMAGKGSFIHFATYSDGEMNVEHWRGMNQNGACLRLVDPDADAILSVHHFALPGAALHCLREDYRIAADVLGTDALEG